jgi:adenine deaminase
MKQSFKISGKIVDIINQNVRKGTITIQYGKIQTIEYNETVDGPYILPGFVDSHIHIESSMVTPQYFAKEAVKHGTIGTVSDPHEITNVLGNKGLETMIKDASQVPFKIFYGVPSCVPATPFETSGAILNSGNVGELIKRNDFYYLAEMMNFPGVINDDPEVLKKIQHARSVNKPVDGHVPGLTGQDLDKYIDAGITTDHECGNYEEAVEKLKKGMKIQIREGSAAKDFDNLYKLIDEFPDSVMLCSDDKHPDELIKGHINKLVQKGIEKGLDLFNLLKAALKNPVEHYNLPVGMLRENDPADFIVVHDLQKFEILQTYINGEKVFNANESSIQINDSEYPNIMNAQKINASDLVIYSKSKPVKVIHARDRTLYTSCEFLSLKEQDGVLQSDPDNDVLKIVVLNRYKSQKPSIGFVKNFGLKKGAIATSVAHDSHNIIAVGVTDEDIAIAINKIIDIGGGNVVYDHSETHYLQLEFEGLMTNQPVNSVAKKYKELNGYTYELGCTLYAPFMTLAFMALPVIPELKITDQGLFDVTKFEYTGLFEE